MLGKKLWWSVSSFVERKSHYVLLGIILTLISLFFWQKIRLDFLPHENVILTVETSKINNPSALKPKHMSTTFTTKEYPGYTFKVEYQNIRMQKGQRIKMILIKEENGSIASAKFISLSN